MINVCNYFIALLIYVATTSTSTAKPIRKTTASSSGTIQNKDTKDAVNTSEEERISLLNEKHEQDVVWKEIEKTCRGYWSGTISHLTYNHKHDMLTPLEESPKRLNFRLEVQIAPFQDHGSWTVHNVMAMGDTRIIPIGRIPKSTPLVHKIGFDSAVIVRFAKQNFVFIEIGFWTDGVRKTVVADFTDANSRPQGPPSKVQTGFKAFWAKRRDNRLSGIALVHQKFLSKAKPTNFAGGDKDVIDDGYLNFMPTDENISTFFRDEENEFDIYKLDSMESIDVLTYERTTRQSLDIEEGLKDEIKKDILKPIKDYTTASRNHKSCKSRNRFTQITHNAVFMSVPKKFGKSKREEIFMFANKISNEKIQVVEIVYDMKPIKAKKITLYTFIPPPHKEVFL